MERQERRQRKLEEQIRAQNAQIAAMQSNTALPPGTASATVLPGPYPGNQYVVIAPQGKPAYQVTYGTAPQPARAVAVPPPSAPPVAGSAPTYGQPPPPAPTYGAVSPVQTGSLGTAPMYPKM